MGQFCPLRHLAMFTDVLGCPSLWEVGRELLASSGWTGDAVKLSMYRAISAGKDYPAQNVNSAEVKVP